MTPLVTMDFGTWSSAAAVVVDHRVLGVKEPASGNYSMPSAVFADGDGPLLVGTAAEAAKRRRPYQYRNEFKRDVGRSAQISLGERAFAVEELVAAVLSTLRANAEAVAGARITGAVLTVPAGAGAVQREAMLSAAEQAGFERASLQLVEEPVAAAFAPAAGAPLPPGETVLVYDFGGGTFDAALVRIGADSRSHEVLDHAGLPHCGGHDVDQLVYADILAAGGELAVRSLTAGPDADERAAQAARRAQLELLDMTRRVKHLLSEAPSAGDYFTAGEIEYEITRERFDAMVAPLVEQTVTCCAELLDRNQMTPEDVAAVLLVGGSTRMPLVADTLAREFRRPLRRAEDPELAVAMGAAHRQATAPPSADATTSAQEPAGVGRAGSTTAAARAQANVTKLIQDPDWARTPEHARALLLDAVLDAPQDEVIEDLITDAALLVKKQRTETERAGRLKIVLLVTSTRVLWVRTSVSEEPSLAEVRMADLTDVRPRTTPQDGLRGLRLVAADETTDFAFQGADDKFLLDLIELIGKRLPAGSVRDGDTVLANLRKLVEFGTFGREPKSDAWFSHAIATAKIPEDLWMFEPCTDGVTKLLTTSGRVLWWQEADKPKNGQLAFHEISELVGLSTAEKGCFAVRVTGNGRTTTFPIHNAYVNVAYIQDVQGQPLAAWVSNLDKLARAPGWPQLDAAARKWLQHTVLSAAEEENVTVFAHCRYNSFNWRGEDGSKTTGLVVTTKRVLWARVGSVAGLSTMAVPITGVKISQISPSKITLTAGGRNHGFAGFPTEKLVAEIRRWHA